jgi:glycosyltransferase involved in cell wall biosynthesis
MVRLLLASYYYPPSIGGVERQSHLLARGLAKRGHAVRVVSARLDGFSATEDLDGVKVWRVSPGRGTRWQKMATYLIGMLVATIRMRSWAEVIQVQQALYPAAATALLAPLLRRPLVVRNSGSGEFGSVQLMRRMPLGAACLGVVARVATGVSLNNEMTREMRQAGFRRLIQIPNGVQPAAEVTPRVREEARRSLGIEGQLVLYVGRLEAEKGVDLLVRAWQLVEDPGATLVIVGDGVDRENLMRLASASATHSAIRFAGASANVQGYLQSADLFVLPSRSEGISNALLEAMASGVPVVATDVGGNREVVLDARLGTLVAAMDADALGRAIGQVLRSPELRKAQSVAARAHVAAHYSVERMIELYEQLYQNISARADHQ